MLLLTLPSLAAVRFNKSGGGASAEVGLSTCVKTLPVCLAQQGSSRERKGQVWAQVGLASWLGQNARPTTSPPMGMSPATSHLPQASAPIPRDVSICAQSLNCVLTLCGPKDCSPPGSYVQGTLQARTLEWAAIPFSQGIFPTQGSNPHLPRWQADPLEDSQPI